MSWIETFSSFFLLAGSTFILIGSLGVLNMPDVLCRSHALSKALTLGIFLMLISLWITLGTEIAGLKVFLAICFQLTTIPLSGHLVAFYFWKNLEQKKDMTR